MGLSWQLTKRGGSAKFSMEEDTAVRRRLKMKVLFLMDNATAGVVEQREAKGARVVCSRRQSRHLRNVDKDEDDCVVIALEEEMCESALLAERRRWPVAALALRFLRPIQLLSCHRARFQGSAS